MSSLPAFLLEAKRIIDEKKEGCKGKIIFLFNSFRERIKEQRKEKV